MQRLARLAVAAVSTLLSLDLDDTATSPAWFTEVLAIAEAVSGNCRDRGLHDGDDDRSA